MSQILLVRHGQAGQLHDYDRLSERGYAQSKKLAEGWAHLGELHAVYRGQMVRHRETLATFSQHYGCGHDPVELPGLDEFNFQDVLAVAHPQLRDPVEGAKWFASHDHPEQAIQKAFLTSMARWIEAGEDPAYAESFPAFRARVLAALDEIAARTKPRETALVVTSGGAISVMVSALMGVPERRAMDVAWALVNTGVTQVQLGGGRRTLGFLNNHHHLVTTPELITHR